MSEPLLRAASEPSSQLFLDGGDSNEVFQLDTNALRVATRVITTAELLDLVLSFLERFDLIKTAPVSQFWLEISRGHIWRIVENAWELFGLLAPLRPSRGNHGHEFERIPSYEDWLRFQPFASRVRRLRIEGPYDDEDCSKVVTALLSKICLYSALASNDNLAQLSLFLHPGLEELIMYVPPNDLAGYPVETICADIAFKAPYIRHLELVPYGCVTSLPIEMALANLLLRLESRLTSLYLPVYGLTQTLFEAASHLQHVEDIAFATTVAPMVVALYHDVLVFTPHLERNSFPALRKLSLCASLADLKEIVSNHNFPANRLSDFLVRAVRPETPAAVETFHATVARECRSLTTYSLVLTAPYDEKGDNERWPESPGPDTILGWTAFAPLADGVLRSLVSIAVAHEHAFKLTIHELADLARSLPNLEYFVCNPSPHVAGGNPPTIKLLEINILPDCMPNVETLELYVDASDATVDYPRWSEKYFPRLRSLWMGASPVNSARRMGISFFLAGLLATGARIDTERWEIWDYAAPESRYVSDWDRIAEDVALLMEARAGVERTPLYPAP
ncbi:hypothetical protein PENSPDRAFT_736700 [Peniophora sp. CONT]|nr:hypothetical protein PENSPDRAFT_736700 [Peniophora sp. CONT]